MSNNDGFNYKYSAPTEQERREIDSIRRQYVDASVPAEDKIVQLRKLDGRVKNPPLILGITLGIVGTLIFGLGLTMVLEWSMLIWGVAVMVAGAIPVSLAYPARKLLYKRNKAKYGEQIIRLSEELLNERGEADISDGK